MKIGIIPSTLSREAQPPRPAIPAVARVKRRTPEGEAQLELAPVVEPTRGGAHNGHPGRAPEMAVCSASESLSGR